MLIPKSQLKKWAALKEQGDLTRISESTVNEKGERITRQTIALAIERGRCSDVTYKAISDYYNKKEASV